MRLKDSIAGLFLTKGTTALLLALAAQSLNAETVQISGTVSSVSTITPGTPAAIDNSQLTGGVTDLAIVTINERSNKKSGYTVTLSSVNAGSGSTAKLLGASTGESINYTMKYGGSSVSLASGQATVTNASDKTSNTGVDKVLSVSIAAGFPAADTYSDTLTLTLTNK